MASPIDRSHWPAPLAALRAIGGILDELNQRWALIGGLAVSVRAEPRVTRDVDLAVAVADDAAAESLVHALAATGYSVVAAIEQNATGRLATIRVVPPHEDLEAGIVVDLLFASSGIEHDIVDAAEGVEILPGLTVPVALTGHLVALKILSLSPKRLKDSVDLQSLLEDVPAAELERAREALALIEQRGYHRGRSLGPILDEMLRGA